VKKLTKLEQEVLITKVSGAFNARELALGYLRYEALRKLNPREFSALVTRNIEGENFDKMVTELIGAKS